MFLGRGPSSPEDGTQRKACAGRRPGCWDRSSHVPQGSGEEDSPAQPCPSALSHSQGYVAPLTHCWCPGGWQKRTTLTVLPRGTSAGHGGVPAQPWLHHSTSQPQQGCVTGWSREEMIQVQDGAAVVLPAQQHESKEGCKEL